MERAVRGAAIIIWWIFFVAFVYISVTILDNLGVAAAFKYLAIATLASFWWMGNGYILKYLRRIQKGEIS